MDIGPFFVSNIGEQTMRITLTAFITRDKFIELLSRVNELWTYESHVQYQSVWGKGPTEKTQIWESPLGEQIVETQTFDGKTTYEYYPSNISKSLQENK